MESYFHEFAMYRMFQKQNILRLEDEYAVYFVKFRKIIGYKEIKYLMQGNILTIF